MDSIKVKNFIIIVLLIVNALLFSVFVLDTVREGGMAGDAVDGAVAILAENGITVAEGAGLDEQSLPVVAMRRDTGLERDKVEKVLGSVNVTDEGGNILRYSSEKGEANFRGTGSFEMLVYDYGRASSDPETTALRFAADLGLEAGRGGLVSDIDPESLDGTVELTCAAGGARVANCVLSFTFGGGEIKMVLGTRVLDTVVSESYSDTLDVPTVLMRFLGLVLDGGRICSSVDSLELCYSMRANAAGEAELIPVWRIATDTGDFYINAVTGFEENV